MEQHLTSNGILTAWETGWRRRPLDRAIVILWAAGVQGDPAALALTERDRILLDIRASTFGSQLIALATCPGCGEDHEIELETKTLVNALTIDEPETIDVGGVSLSIRPINSYDLAAASQLSEEQIPTLLRKRLAGRETVPGKLQLALDKHIETYEEKAELTTRLTCVACESVWKEVLDVASLLWAEIEAAAIRLFGEVAEIAAALGWSEREILSLSDPRRQVYLKLARQM